MWLGGVAQATGFEVTSVGLPVPIKPPRRHRGRAAGFFLIRSAKGRNGTTWHHVVISAAACASPQAHGVMMRAAAGGMLHMSLDAPTLLSGSAR
jgi:hypothetical protein